MFTVKLVHLLSIILSEREKFCSGKSLSTKKKFKNLLYRVVESILFSAIFNFEVEKCICGGSIQTIISGVCVTFYS